MTLCCPELGSWRQQDRCPRGQGMAWTARSPAAKQGCSPLPTAPRPGWAGVWSAGDGQGRRRGRVRHVNERQGLEGRQHLNRNHG